MLIFQTNLSSYEINSKKLHESLILYFSYKKPHFQQFSYFIPYIVKTICMILFDVNTNPASLHVTI